MTRPGVRFSGESPLLARAIELVGRRPRATGEVAERVLGIRGGPAPLTERLVRELLDGDPRIGRDPEGRWILRRAADVPDARDGLALDRLRFAVVDVETTGGVAGGGGRVIEIAVVHVERGQILDAYATLVNPGRAISPWIRRLTGIADGMVGRAPSFSDVADEVRRRLAGRIFVAHAAGYDWGFVREELWRLGTHLPPGPRLCTLQFSRRVLPGLDRRSLDALAAYYGIRIRQRHRARGDAIATARILLRLLGDAERRGWTDWESVRRALSGAAEETGPEVEAGGAPC